MVEQRSSTPYVWVRLPLSLKIFLRKKYKKQHSIISKSVNSNQVRTHIIPCYYKTNVPLINLYKSKKLFKAEFSKETLFVPKSISTTNLNTWNLTQLFKKIKVRFSQKLCKNTPKTLVKSVALSSKKPLHNINVHYITPTTKLFKLYRHKLKLSTHKSVKLRQSVKKIYTHKSVRKYNKNNLTKHNTLLLFKNNNVFKKKNTPIIITKQLPITTLFIKNNPTLLQYAQNNLSLYHSLINLKLYYTQQTLLLNKVVDSYEKKLIIHSTQYTTPSPLTPSTINLTNLYSGIINNLNNYNNTPQPTLKNNINTLLCTLSDWSYNYSRSLKYSTNLSRLPKMDYFNQYSNVFLTNSSTNNYSRFYINLKKTNNELQHHLSQTLLLKTLYLIKISNTLPLIFTKHNNTFLNKKQTNTKITNLSNFYTHYHNIKYTFNNKPIYKYINFSNKIYTHGERLPLNTKFTNNYSTSRLFNLKRVLYTISRGNTRKVLYSKNNITAKHKKRITNKTLYYRYPQLSKKNYITTQHNFQLRKSLTKKKHFRKNFKKILLWEKIHLLQSKFTDNTVGDSNLNTTQKTLTYSLGKDKHNKLSFNKIINTKLFFLSNRFSSFLKTNTPKYLKTLLINSHSHGGVNNLNYKIKNKSFNPSLLITTKTSHLQHKTVRNRRSNTNNNELSFINQGGIEQTKNNPHTMLNLVLLENPLLLKLFLPKNNDQVRLMFSLPQTSSLINNPININNILPSSNFRHTLVKKVYSSLSYNKVNLNFIPIYYTTLIRFMENISGNKILIQFYPFVNQSVTENFIIKYKLWLPRLSFYEKRLGHKFFLEESLHILHLSFVLKDPRLLLKWLKAIILRISFWRTRSIFRFIKYLMLNFFEQSFETLKIKGFKVKLKGKISAAGNSRKRSILYRVGQTSHSTLDLKVLTEIDTVVTFTGVMGLTVSLFY